MDGQLAIIAGLSLLSHLSDKTPRTVAIHNIRDELRAMESKDKLTTDEKTARTDLRIIEQMYLLADYALVGLGDNADNESLRLYWCPNSHPYFERLPKMLLRRLAIRAAQTLTPPISLSGPRVERLIATFMNRPYIIPNIERRVFYVSEDLYYDTTKEPGEQLIHASSLDSNSRCFFHLFDSTNTDKDIVAFPQSTFNKAFSRKVSSAYDSLLSKLEELCPNPSDPFPSSSLSATNQSDDPLPRHFSFIEDWANGNPGLYWDLLTIPATVFLKEKPSISYFLSGSSMNGKSSYLGLIHTVLGANNTTRIRLSDMDKWHLNTQLQYTLFNAPDDEGDSISSQSAEFFKSIASHGTISLPIMRSQVPMRLNADFMSAHPMNASPDWGDASSASALTRRTCLIPFTADFRGRASSTSNFARDTFTPDVLAQFVGEVLALASFYSEHPLCWSQTTQGAKQQVEAENDSIRLYKERWEKYFWGFQSIRLLYDDYKCWCRDNGFDRVAEKAAFQIHWFSYTSNLVKGTLTDGNGKPICSAKGKPIRKNAYMNPNKGVIAKARKFKGLAPLITMLDDTVLPKPMDQYGTIAQMHATDDMDKVVGRTSFSAVTLLEKLEEGYGD